jgi:hypothetical protein
MFIIEADEGDFVSEGPPGAERLEVGDYQIGLERFKSFFVEADVVFVVFEEVRDVFDDRSGWGDAAFFDNEAKAEDSVDAVVEVFVQVPVGFAGGGENDIVAGVEQPFANQMGAAAVAEAFACDTVNYPCHLGSLF